MIRPLAGLKVIEFEGIGPGPLAGRWLADHGAEVVAVVRPNKATLGNPDRAIADDPLRRGKRVVALDLKRADAVEEAMGLIETADALIEGNRPGVIERLGLGPADCARRNPRLVYGRMTGWVRRGRWRRRPGTISTTPRSAARCRSAGGPATRRSFRRPCSATRAARSGSPSES